MNGSWAITSSDMLQLHTGIKGFSVNFACFSRMPSHIDHSSSELANEKRPLQPAMAFLSVCAPDELWSLSQHLAGMCTSGLGVWLCVWVDNTTWGVGPGVEVWTAVCGSDWGSTHLQMNVPQQHTHIHKQVKKTHTHTHTLNWKLLVRCLERRR